MRKFKFYSSKRKLFLTLAVFAFTQYAFAQEKELRFPSLNYAELKFTADFQIPAGDSDKEKAVSANAGGKILLKNIFMADEADLRWYAALPKTNFSVLEECENWESVKDLVKEPKYGIGIATFKSALHISAKIGHNSFSKSVSKIKNPSPSATANPLTKSFGFSSGIGASLPSSGTASQPFSAAVSFSVPESQFFIPMTAEFLFTEEKNAIFSTSAKYAITRFTSITTSFTGGRFYLEGNSSVLEKNNATFDGDWYLAGLIESSFKSPFLKLNGYLGLHQSPYNTVSMWFKIDGRTSFGPVLVDFSYFAVPTTRYSPKAAPLIGGSNSIQRTVEQASINPQIMFIFNDRNVSSLRIGATVLENWKVTNTNVPVQLNTMKIRGGISYESKSLDARFDFTAANILLEGTPPIKSATPEKYFGCTLNSKISQSFMTASFAADYKFYPALTEDSSRKDEFSIRTTYTPGFCRNFSIQNEISCTLKSLEKYSSEFQCSISYKTKQKYFRTYVKAGLSIPF